MSGLNQIFAKTWLLLALGFFLVACESQPSGDEEDIPQFGENPPPGDGGGDTGGGDGSGDDGSEDDSGTLFSLSLSSQADFSSFSLNQSLATSGGDLVLQRDVIVESGRVDVAGSIDDGHFQAVSFRNTYTSPVVVAFLASNNDSDPIEVRVRNVTSTSAEIFMEGPDNSSHGTETISYLVIEQGRHEFQNGLVIEAGKVTTSSAHSGLGGSFGGESISFSSPFSGSPAIFHSLNTYNNSEFMASIAHSIDANDFLIQQEAAETGHVAVSEDIAWVAFSTGSSSLNSSNIEVGLSSCTANCGMDDVPLTLSWSAFLTAPDIIAKQQTGNGNNGGWFRANGNWSSTGIDVAVDEDTINDSERAHTIETVGYVALNSDSDLGAFYTSGTALSQTYDISAVKVVASSIISWNATSPGGTSLVLETNLSLNQGNTWQGWVEASSGLSIPGVTEGIDLSMARLQVRISFTSTQDESSAALEDLSLSISPQ